MALVPCTILLGILSLTTRTSGLKTAEIITGGGGTFLNVVEKGVVVTGKSSLLFSVKACSNAVIVLSDTISVANNSGHYFLLMIGSTRNTMVLVQDSCFQCSRTNGTRAKILDCDHYTDIWTRWDQKGFFEAGTGTTVGVDTVISITGQMENYEIHTAGVTSTARVQAHWKFTATESETVFFLPVPSGSTKVNVNELASVNFKVLDIVIKPQNSEVTFSLAGDTADMFKIEESSLKLAKRLNYEDRQFHTLTIGTNIGLSTSMTVLVTDAIDENPVVNISDVITIPEELPIGTVIGWNMTVHDPDAGDHLTFQLQGVLSDKLAILPNGHVQVLKRIDRESMDVKDLVSTSTLTVSDSENLQVKVSFTTEVKDINDNRPSFNKAVYTALVMENATKDVSVMNLHCSDLDGGGSGQMKLRIVDDEFRSIFYLENTVLYVKAGQLDFETSVTHVEHVIVEAVDQPNAESALTGTTVVLIQILPRDEFKPHWISPSIRKDNTFNDITISKSSPSGTTVTVFRVKDRDMGETVSYEIITTGSTDNILSIFHIDAQTGELTTRDTLVGSLYNIVVVVSSGNVTLTGKLTVMVRTESNTIESPSLKFERSVYLIPEPTKTDAGKTLVTVRVISPDTSSVIDVSMNTAGQDVYVLETHNDEWTLVLKDSILRQDTVSIPTVVRLTATDKSSHKKATTYIAVDTHLIKEDTPASTTTTTSLITTLASSSPSTETQTSPASSTTTTLRTSLTTETSSSASSTQTTVSHSECPVPDKTREIILWSIIGIQWIAIAMMLAYYFIAGVKRKKNNKIEPERRDPLGCEPASTKETLLEIEDETEDRDIENKHDCTDGNTNETLNIQGDEPRTVDDDGVIQDTRSCDGVVFSDDNTAKDDLSSPSRSVDNGQITDSLKVETSSFGLETQDADADAVGDEAISQQNMQDKETAGIGETFDRNSEADCEIERQIENQRNEDMQEDTRGTANDPTTQFHTDDVESKLTDFTGADTSERFDVNSRAESTHPVERKGYENTIIPEDTTLNETIPLSDVIQQDDFDYTLSRMEEYNQTLTKDDTMDTHLNIDSLPNFQFSNVQNRLCTSPSTTMSNPIEAVITPCAPVVANPFADDSKADSAAVNKANRITPKTMTGGGISFNKTSPQIKSNKGKGKSAASHEDGSEDTDSDLDTNDDEVEEEEETVVEKEKGTKRQSRKNTLVTVVSSPTLTTVTTTLPGLRPALTSTLPVSLPAVYSTLSPPRPAVSSSQLLPPPTRSEGSRPEVVRPTTKQSVEENAPSSEKTKTKKGRKKKGAKRKKKSKTKKGGSKAKQKKGKRR